MMMICIDEAEGYMIIPEAFQVFPATDTLIVVGKIVRHYDGVPYEGEIWVRPLRGRLPEINSFSDLASYLQEGEYSWRIDQREEDGEDGY
jgi:hypothetical protein